MGKRHFLLKIRHLAGILDSGDALSLLNDFSNSGLLRVFDMPMNGLPI
jgi:hypothetical protein